MSALSKEELYRLVDEHREHPAGKRIVLFGAGKIGHAALAFCEAEKIAVACIADNNQTLWGQTIQGVRVIPPRDIPALKPTLVILAVGQSAEIAEQLDGYGIDCYLSYFLFQYRYHVEELAQPGALPTERACGWLLRNQQENGGVSVFRGSPDEYPEVTGYIIPTMLQYGFQDEALRMAGFLASRANGDGSFTAADSSRVYVFDTAQALRGLNAICKVTDRYTDLRQKTAEYLFDALRENGGVFPKNYEDDPIIPETIQLFALPALLDYARTTGGVEQEEAVHRAARQYLQSPEALSAKTLTHFLAYQIDGLIDLGYREEVRPILEKLLASQREDGAIPACEGVDWVCITGCAQLAICLYKLGMPEPANRLVAWVERNMEEDGGFLGSAGPGAWYFPDKEPSWAVKFYLDAYKRMIRAHFDYEFAPIAPDSIPENDGEVLAVLRELNGGERVLEVGCGKGRILKRVHERFPGCELEGVDISEGILAYVPDFVRTERGEVEFLPYADGQFDLVYTVECIEHSVNLRAAVRELARVCRPGGKIVIIDKQQSNWGRLATPPWERWPERAGLESILREHCASVTSRPVQPSGFDARDEMFIAWIGVK